MIDPLEWKTWFDAIRSLQGRCGTFALDHQERLIRHAYHLCQLAPQPLRELVRPEMDEDRIERLLEIGAFESAVLGVLGTPMTYAVSRAEPGLFDVNVSLPGDTALEPIRSTSLPVGLVAAWARRLLLMSRGTSADFGGSPQAPGEAGSNLRLV